MSTWMQAHYPRQYNFFNRFCYKNGTSLVTTNRLCKKTYDSLEIATEEAISWAEFRVNQQAKFFGEDLHDS
jgi:hypothetical protein